MIPLTVGAKYIRDTLPYNLDPPRVWSDVSRIEKRGHEEMGAGHNHDVAFDGMSDDYRRRLIIVIAINAAMFIVEMTAGQLQARRR